MSFRKVVATEMISVLCSLVGVKLSSVYLLFLVEVVGSAANASSAARREDTRWIAMVG